MLICRFAVDHTLASVCVHETGFVKACGVLKSFKRAHQKTRADQICYYFRTYYKSYNFWATVCKMVRAMLSDCCLFCLCPVLYVGRVLSVTLVYCGQTFLWIKMKHGVQLGLGSGHIVLDGDPAPAPQKWGRAPNFWPMSIVAKWLDGSRCHLVRRQAPGKATLC